MIERLQVRVPAEAEEEFSSPELTFCADSYSVSVPPRDTAVACKRPRSFCKQCRWQATPKHAYTLDPTKSEWADYAAVQAQCGILPGNELAHMSANIWPQSSRLAEPLWTDPNTKSGISVREPISNSEYIKRRRGVNGRTFSQSPRNRGKSHHHSTKSGFLPT